MRFLKNTSYISLIVSFLMACNSDAEKITLSGFETPALIPSQNDVTITKDNQDASVLSFVWTESELTTSNNSVGVSNTQRTYLLQMDASSEFAEAKEFTLKVASKSFTGSELNALALKYGLKAEQAGKLYFRVKATIAENMATLISNTVTINVTPAPAADDTKGIIYLPTKSSNFTDFGNKLYSSADNGKYSGFVYANQWDNFRVYTTNNTVTATVYGSKPNELYVLDNSDSKWDIWYDEGGYFYVEADLNAKTWKKTKVNSLVLTGDFNGWSTTATPLTYDPVTKLWTATCNISTIGWGVKFLVNEDWNWAYTDTNDDGYLEKTGDPNIMPKTTGIYKVTVDLSNPAKLSYKFEKQ